MEQSEVNNLRLAQNNTKNTAACVDIKTNKVLAFTYAKILNSPYIKPDENLCKLLTEYINVNESEILITTKRKGRSHYLCLMISVDGKCKSLLGALNKGIDPSQALHYTFSKNIVQNTVQKETIERLFIKPSLLID